MNIHLLKRSMVLPPPDIKSGYITLLSVLIASAVITAIAITLLLSGVNASRQTQTLETSRRANSFAKACAEEALEQVRDSSSFSGSGGLTFGGGTCSYSVVNTGGDSRLVQTTGISASVVRRIKITIDAINPRINVASWQEVTDF